MFRRAERRGEQLIDLLACENQRQSSFWFWKLQFAHRIFTQIFSFGEKAIEGAERGKLQSDVGARLLLFHQLEEIIAEIIWAAVAPGAGSFLSAKIFERLTIGDQC